MAALRALLSEAQAKGYGGSEPCEELKATIQEAEKCSGMALQISGKHRAVTTVATRNCASTEKKMDVDELVKFLEQVDLLPCKIPEASILLVWNGAGRNGMGEGLSRITALFLLVWNWPGAGRAVWGRIMGRLEWGWGWECWYGTG